MLETKKVHCGDLGCMVQIAHFPIEKNTILRDSILLHKKKEFHVTLFGKKTLSKIKKFCSNEQQENLMEFIHNFTFVFKPTNKIHFLRKDYSDHIRYSRIVEVSMLYKEEFEKKFSTIVGFKYSFFPHITTHSTATVKEKNQNGIGISSAEELSQYKLDK